MTLSRFTLMCTCPMQCWKLTKTPRASEGYQFCRSTPGNLYHVSWAVFQLYQPHGVQQCFPVANVHVHCKQVKVCMSKANLILCTSYHLPSNGTGSCCQPLFCPISHLFSQLLDLIKEFYHKCYGVHPTADMLTHLKRELIHASLWLIFHGSFADAQNNGQITWCADDIIRCWLL